MGYCLQIVFQREYNYDLMTQENLTAVTFWIVTFVVMLILIMVNLMLAMIFDSYGVVRDGVLKEQTMWNLCRRLLTQFRLQSAWSSNTDLMVKLSTLPVEDSPTLASVKMMFPDIAETQLDIVFQHATNRQSQVIA